MPGNSIGHNFKVTTFGESHGIAIGCVIDGCPSKIPLSVDMIQKDLDRRRPGQSQFVSQRRESDQVQIMSGVFEGKTLGTPIMLLIYNQDAKAKDYVKLKTVLRPGHGDFTYFHKYGHVDHRGGGRASARETAARVAAGAVAKQVLQQRSDIEITGYLSQIGDEIIHFVDKNQINKNPFFCANADQVSDIEDRLTAVRKQQNSMGAKVSVQVANMPIGLGEPVFDGLDADIAKALMSINACKAVEIGDGCSVVKQQGSEHRDIITPDGFKSNHAGGVLAGISTGQTLVAHASFKPTSSIPQEVKTVDRDNNIADVRVTGRHDPCVGIRAVPVCEAMMALVLADHILRNSC